MDWHESRPFEPKLTMRTQPRALDQVAAAGVLAIDKVECVVMQIVTAMRANTVARAAAIGLTGLSAT